MSKTRSKMPPRGWKVDLLNLMLEGTQAGVLRWRQENPESFVARFGGQTYSILLLYPLYADEGSDRAAARISTASVGGITLFGGTECMEMVWEILATAFPKRWSEHWNCIRIRLKKEMHELRRAIANAGRSEKAV